MIGFVLTLGWFLWLIPGAMLVLMGVMRLLLALRMSGPPGIREGWITGVVGRMGQGKSLYVMTRARQHLAHGGTVISNFRIDTSVTGGTWYEYRGWIPLLECLVARMEQAERDDNGRPVVEPALVLLDEAHLYAPASGVVLPEVARWILSHLRKLRAEMMWCTQHEGRIAKGLADQTAEVVNVRRNTIKQSHFSASHWEPEKFRRRGEEMLFKVGYSLSPKVLSMYNSWDLIRPDQHGDEAGIVGSLIDRLEALQVVEAAELREEVAA